jgi:hypothetical protein
MVTALTMPPIPWRHRQARSAWFATVVTVLVVLDGAFGSLYSEEIRAAFPFYVGHGQVAWHALLFWGATIVTALLFFGRQRALDHARHMSEVQLSARADELAQLIRTLPPAGFLWLCHDLDWQCAAVVLVLFRKSRAQCTPEEVQYAIRVVLSAVAVLAHYFDGRPSDVMYAANIMLFRPSSSLTDSEERELEGRLRFSEPEAHIRNLEGVLDLRCDLSTTNRVEGARPDAQLAPLALPIPFKTKSDDGLRSRVLPGAPRAFCDKALDLYANTGTLAEWCRTKGDFSGSVIQQVESYFQAGTGRHFQSLVSLPLAWQADQPGVGVLNIHCSNEGILRSQDRSENESIRHFVAVTGSFRSTLMLLLDLLRECEARTPGTSASQAASPPMTALGNAPQ